jgi:hypothetical protein
MTLTRKQLNEVLASYLESFAERAAWLELAENQFKRYGDNWLTYYALFRHEELEYDSLLRHA